MVALHCRDCPHWYGSEDDGYGPCTVKSQRGARRPLTYGGHTCDEGYDVVSGAVVFVGARAAPAAAPRGPSPKPKAKRAPARQRASGKPPRRRRPSKSKESAKSARRRRR